MKSAIIKLWLVLFLVNACLVVEVFSQAPVKPIKPKYENVKMKLVAKSTKDIKSLAQAFKAGVPVIVKLGSDTCYPCRQMKPIISQLATEQDGKIVFLDLDIYENRALAKEFQVRVIPTLIYNDKQGKVKGKTEGGMSKEQLMNTIKELKL